jgi:F-type H+-transporting ATPase subunit b
MRFAFPCRLFALAALVVLLTAVPALAADPHGEKGGGLDFTGIKRYDLGIYTLVVFLLLVAIIWKFAWPHIKEGLEKREVNIRGALDEAKATLLEARKDREEAKRQLLATAGQVKEMLDEARKDAEALRAEYKEAGVKEVQAEKARAEREIANKRAGLDKEVYEHAVKLAALMAEKALRRQVSIEDHRRLLDEALAELKDGASKA